MTLSQHLGTRLGVIPVIAVSSLFLHGCAVIAAVDTVASVAIGTAGLAAGAVIGTARIAGSAVGATANAVLPNPSKP